MEYKVELTSGAVSDIREIRGYIRADEVLAGNRWYLGLREAVFSLNRMPYRGRVTPEASGFRQLLYGNKPHVYRIIYLIDEAGQRVVVLHMRHGARDAFDPDRLTPSVWKLRIGYVSLMSPSLRCETIHPAQGRLWRRPVER